MAFEYTLLSDVDLEDTFFDSLRADYVGFDSWFHGKAAASEQAYTFKNDDGYLEGFLYLKIEDGEVQDVTPSLAAFRRVKIGTFKINAHGTRLGERFLKKAFDWAIESGAQEIYVTVLPKHDGLLQLLGRYGFEQVAHKGDEQVLVKTIGVAADGIDLEYPGFRTAGGGYLLSIYPTYHTSLFPDSHLKTEEQDDFLHDTSNSNAIQKIYICSMDGVLDFRQGDPVVIYRTAEPGKAAEYNSVATSICVFKSYRHLSSFDSEKSFIDECEKYSVFSKSELSRIWKQKKYQHIIYFTYNVSLESKLTRHSLIEELGIQRDQYWGVVPISQSQLAGIMNLGGVDEGLAIN